MSKIYSMQQDNYNKSQIKRVCVIRCADYKEQLVRSSLEKTLDMLGGIDKFISRTDKVLLKPNFIAPKPAQNATQTHPVIILELARLLKDYGAKPFVADSPAWGNVQACTDVLGLTAALDKINVPIKHLNKPKRCKIAGSWVGISRVALEADKIINLPKFKTHQQMTATFAVKNMYGCVTGKEKAFWHFARGQTHARFSEMLIGIYQRINPVFNIIDGILAMEGPGPINGTPRQLGFLIAGTEPISCETICAELINFRPEEIPIIRTARKLGFGCSQRDKIEVVGDDYRPYICSDFERAQQMDLRFPFRQVCKSIMKQIWLLTTTALKKHT